MPAHHMLWIEKSSGNGALLLLRAITFVIIKSR